MFANQPQEIQRERSLFEISNSRFELLDMEAPQADPREIPTESQDSPPSPPSPPPSPSPSQGRKSRTPSPKATRFTAIVSSFQDDIASKLGDWCCGYSSLLLDLGFLEPGGGIAARNSDLRHLDVGCGKGALCFQLHRTLGLGRVVGADVVAGAIDECRRRYVVPEPLDLGRALINDACCGDAAIDSASRLHGMQFELIARRSDEALPFPGMCGMQWSLCTHVGYAFFFLNALLR